MNDFSITDSPGAADPAPTSEPALDQQLRRHLDVQASMVPVGDTPVETVIRRGVERRNRRRATGGVLGVAAMAVTAIVGVQVLSQPTPRRITTAAPAIDTSSTLDTNATLDTTPRVDETTPEISQGVSTAKASNLVWNHVVPNSAEALGFTYSFPFASAATPGPYYSFSTQPGVQSDVAYIPTMYRSQDGIAWQVVSDTPAASSSRTFDSYDGHLYSFGTSAASGALADQPAGLDIESSDDQGLTWTNTTLPVDLQALAALPGVQRVSGGYLSIASGSGGVLVAAKPNLEFDLHLLRPDQESSGATYMPDGVQITSDALYAWSELGVDQQAVDAYFAPPHLFFSPDGSSFTETLFPPIPSGLRAVSATVFALSDGFALSTEENVPGQDVFVSELSISTDGTTWHPATSPFEYVRKISELDDGTLVAFASSGPDGIATSTDRGITWTTTETQSFLATGDGASASIYSEDGVVGPSGITVVASINLDPFIAGGPVSLTQDGITMSLISNDGEFLFTDAATDAELGRMDNASNVNTRVNDQTGSIDLLAIDGTVRTTLTSDQQNQLWNESSIRFPARLVLLHSADGVQWTRDDIDEIAGFTAVFSSLLATPSGVLLTVTDPATRNADGSPRTVVLVGTPGS